MELSVVVASDFSVLKKIEQKILQWHQHIHIYFEKGSDTLKRPFGNIWNVQENSSGPGFCQSAIWSRNFGTWWISLSASCGWCLMGVHAYGNSPACWTEIAWWNWVPGVSVSRYLLVNISLLTILFYIYIYRYAVNKWSKKQEVCHSGFELSWLSVLHFGFLVISYFQYHCGSIVCCIIPAVLSGSAFTAIQDCMPRMSCCLLCHRINIVKM